MTVKLFLRPSPTAADEGQFQWGLFSYVGEPLGSGESTLDELIATVSQNGLADVRVHYVIPASLVTLCRAVIPARQARHIQQALPFAVEDALAEDVENLHLVLCGRPVKDTWSVLAISHDMMTEYHALVSQFPWPLAAIFVDAEGVPGETGVVSLVIDRDAVLIHQPGQFLIRVLKENALPFLEILGASLQAQGVDSPVVLKAYVNDASREEDRVLLAQLEHLEGLRTETPVYGVTPFELISHTLAAAGGTNLCQGPYRSHGAQEERPWLRWWPVAAAASLVLVVQVALFVVEGYLHDRNARTYQAQTLKIYRQLYPAETQVLSPRRQLEGKIRSAGDAGGRVDFLKMLAEAGFQLKQQAGADAMQLNSFQYNQRGELALEVRAGTLDQLDRYKQALNNAGYLADLGAAIKESDGVRGRVTVKGG